MILGQIAPLILFLAVFTLGPAKLTGPSPSWTVRLPDQPHSDVLLEGLTNRSCGIAKWDATRVLIYYLISNKHLAVRGPADQMEGGWLFSVQIVRTEDGKIEESTTIPAWGPKSELAVVQAGIVESDHDRLVFYSRTLKRLDHAFSFLPIQNSISALPNAYGLGDSERIYVTTNQSTFVLVDGGKDQSHFFVFDGATFEKQRDWIVPMADWRSISIRDEGLLFSKPPNRTQVFLTTFDGHLGTWPNPFGLLDPQICGFSFASDPGALLYSCGMVKVVGPKNTAIVYKPGKNEVVGLPVAISSGRHLAAILDYTYKGGGRFDLTEGTERILLLIVNLDVGFRVWEVPVTPIPHSQVAFGFADDSTLIVLNDATVTAYASEYFN